MGESSRRNESNRAANACQYQPLPQKERFDRSGFGTHSDTDAYLFAALCNSICKNAVDSDLSQVLRPYLRRFQAARERRICAP